MFVAAWISFAHCLLWMSAQGGVNQAGTGLRFFDNFGLNQVDSSRWTVASRMGQTDGELQYYLPDNVQAGGGTLALIAKAESVTREGVSANFTAGMVDTKDTFHWLYGELEVRAKMPKGKGIRASITLLQPSCVAGEPCPDHFPPAVSLLDFRGDQPDNIQSMVFYENAKTHQTLFSAMTYRGAADLSFAFHTYRLHWTRDRLAWSLDDLEYFVFNESAKIPSAPMQIVMRVAVVGAPDGWSTFPTEMSAAYVSVRAADRLSALHSSAGSAARCVPVLLLFILFLPLCIHCYPTF